VDPAPSNPNEPEPLDQRPIGPGMGTRAVAQIGSLAIGWVRAPDLRAAAQVRLQSHLLLPLPNQARLNRALHHSRPS
jgi:hypothetical protein